MGQAFITRRGLGRYYKNLQITEKHGNNIDTSVAVTGLNFASYNYIISVPLCYFARGDTGQDTYMIVNGRVDKQYTNSGEDRAYTTIDVNVDKGYVTLSTTWSGYNIIGPGIVVIQID